MAWTDAARAAAAEARRHRPKKAVPDSVYAKNVSRPQMAKALRQVRAARDQNRINKGFRRSNAAKVMNKEIRTRAYIKVRESIQGQALAKSLNATKEQKLHMVRVIKARTGKGRVGRKLK